MGMKGTVLCLFLLLLHPILSVAATDDYTEKVVVKPLPDGQVYTFFEFKTIWQKEIRDINWADHFDAFPLSLGKFVGQHEIQELHFSLTKGIWKHKTWGFPVRDSPPGAELWVWFQYFHKNPSKAWKDVTSILSGQFCASLNFIDKAATIQPRLSLRPEGVIDGNSVRNESLFYAALPHEAVCTENLTPWKKLLPCFSQAGLASLLNAGHLFNTNYFSLALDLRPVCRTPSCKETSVELIQTISIVFNPPVMFEGKQSWSLFKLFGSPLKEECKLSSSTSLYVDISHNDSSNPHVLSPTPTSVITKTLVDGEIRKYAFYDMKRILKDYRDKKTKKHLNIGSLYKKDHTYSSPEPPPIFATRFISGYGVSQGGIVCRLTNRLTTNVRVIYLDIIPWYLRIYMHSLRVKNSGVELKPHSIFYKPAKDRSQPHHIELVLTLPPQSVTEITFEFDRSYLKWTEYPPDANHGVYVGSALISTVLESSRNMTFIPSETSADNYFIRIHTESLLVSLPTPDFSMPYNVICLVSTVVSLAFGPIHNLTTRRARIAEEPGEGREAGGGLLSRFKRFFKRKGNPQNEQPTVEATTSQSEGK